VQLVPACDDARRLWATWVVEWGGEGIVLKHRRSVYRPGVRSRVWWKAKHRLVLPVEVLQCAPELIEWGDWGGSRDGVRVSRPAIGRAGHRRAVAARAAG
jgi:hypothetical protein